MKILLLGGGGREHALAWKIAQSNKCSKLFIAPGNAGTANCGENIDIKADDFESLKKFCVNNIIDIVVVGPEDPLVKGIYDDFKNDERTKDIPVIGPSKAGAVLEGSKDFAKGFMLRHNIPTAKYKTFDGTNIEEGLKFLETLKAPYVLKADGLCAGCFRRGAGRRARDAVSGRDAALLRNDRKRRKRRMDAPAGAHLSCQSRTVRLPDQRRRRRQL